MQESQALADAILDAIDEPALIVCSGIIASANQAAQLLLGRQIIGRDLRFAIRHPLALDTIQAGRAADVELMGIGSAERSWQMSVRPVPGGAMIRLSDRSAVRSAERMRTDFVANASHELRTPLATIIGYAETLTDESPVDEAMRGRFGATIQSEARRMLRIVEDLMSLSRIEADRYRAPDEKVDLGEVVRIAIEQSGPLAGRRTCDLSLEIEDGLPAIAGDFAQLAQLTDNLLTNALRYGCNKRSCSIAVRVSFDGRQLLLSVSDKGDGIPPQHLPRLTERFYRVAPSRSRDSGGTGLGLAIVKHIVERHHGTLDITSAPGEGTTVSVALPLS